MSNEKQVKDLNECEDCGLRIQEDEKIMYSQNAFKHNCVKALRRRLDEVIDSLNDRINDRFEALIDRVSDLESK